MYYSKHVKIQRIIVKNPYYKDPLAKRKQDLFDPHKIKEILCNPSNLQLPMKK